WGLSRNPPAPPDRYRRRSRTAPETVPWSAFAWARSAGRRAWDVEAAVEGSVAAVLSNHFHLALATGDEAEGDYWIGAERNIGIQVKDLAALVAGVYGSDETRGCEIPRDLVHLHAVEVRMPDHQLRLHRFAGVEFSDQTQLHPADISQGSLIVGTRRCRAAASRFHEPGCGMQLPVRCFRNGVNVRIGIDPDPQLQLPGIGFGSEDDVRCQRRRIVIDDQ